MNHIGNIKIEKKDKLHMIAHPNSLLAKMYEETSMGETANGAKTFIRSGSALLDFFAQAGAMRNNPTKALDLFQKAFAEDRQSALRVLFYLRDVRGGQGERKLFRNCLEWLGTTFPDVFNQIITHVPEYGRFDDLFFDDKVCYSFIGTTLEGDKVSENPTLLGKWLPTINASSPSTRAKARLIAKALGLSDKAYRKTIRDIRKKIKTVEEQMSARKWADIEYSKVPSQAARIYKNAFKKHDEARYTEFIGKAEKGEVKINAATLYPYQLYKSAMSDYSQTLEALWNQLPDYTQGNNALVVADTSGSMSGDPMSVSVSLALYFAERNKGQFKDYFITFSGNPILQKISGKTLRDKMNSIQTGEVANTDLQKVFDLILNAAIANETPASELPSTIYMISDMEFDYCCDTHTNFEHIQLKYEASGYKMPTLVFWNVNASGSNLPVQKNKQGVTLVSGFSPTVFKMVVENKTPEQVMFDVINATRYAPIVLE
jgi:hypothetical protein